MPKQSKRKASPLLVAGKGTYARLLADEDGLGHGLGPCPQPLTPSRPAARSRARLVPSEARAEPLGSGLDRKFLATFVAHAASSLPQSFWDGLGRSMGGAPAPIRIKVGTACSGSEIYLTAMPLLAAEIATRLRRPVHFDHRWSCELDANKRQWIADNFAPPRLFADITALAAGPCHDFVSGALAEVEIVDLVIAGTSCKDASRLNNQHAARLNVVEKGTHSTGATFQGLTRLVAKFGLCCRLVCLENVTSLRDKDPRTGRSNFDGVADAVRSLGFGFVSAAFSAEDTGLPIARPRLYMSGVRCSDEALAQRAADAVLAAMISRACPVPLEALLLQEAAPLFLMSLWMPEALLRDGACSCDVQEQGWQQQHKAAWRDIPPSVQAHVLPQFTGNPWLRTLSPRQRDLLFLVSCQDHMTAKKALAIPLHSSVGWETSSSATCLQTLVPKGVYWLVERKRPLLGVEAIRLQGCDPASLPGLVPARHDAAFLSDLAGNAFCVYQFCLWLLAALAAGDLASFGLAPHATQNKRCLGMYVRTHARSNAHIGYVCNSCILYNTL